MKIWAVVAVIVAMVTAAHGEQLPPVCGTCQCLDTVPFDVDCTNQMLEQLPDLTQNSFEMPWRMDLTKNSIEELNKFPRLPNLVTLIIDWNQITSIADEAFLDLPKLRSLSLQHNKLTEESLKEPVMKGQFNGTLSSPIGLEELDLSYNLIKSVDSHAFLHLSYLKRLFMSNNPIMDISLNMARAINELSSLEELDLSQTGIQRLPQHFLSDLRQLKVLTLAGNRFSTVPSELSFVHTLTELNLNDNPIKSITMGDFQENLSTLQVLQISAMPNLRNIGKQAFSSLSNLKVLHLSDSPNLSIIDPEAFFILPGNKLALQEIHIQNNNLMTLDRKMLPWTDLQLVDLQNNPWNCDCNIKWIAVVLIPDLEAKNPETTLSIMCAEPIADRGVKMTDLLAHSHTFQCSKVDPFVRHEGRYGPLIVGTIIIGTLLLLTGTLVFTFVLYKRTRDNQLFGERVKYRRAQDEDEEGVAHTVHS